MISTQQLSALPTIERVCKLSQTLATLDTILCPEWEGRYYAFNAQWDTNEMLASMRNTSGDGYFLLFSPAGAILKGFAHESPMSPYHSDPPQIWRGVLDAVPSVFASFLNEPAFVIKETTFCIWRTISDPQWHHGPIHFPAENDPDGSTKLLLMFDNNPRIYQRWAEEYYEQSIHLKSIQALYAFKPLTQSIVTSLNRDCSIDDIRADLDEIQYPYVKN